MAEREEPDDLTRDLRTDWHRYVDALVPLRPDLHAYCRRLTGSVFDAEDLVQDTLVRAFARWGVSYPRLRNPRSYLLRTATNVWIDWQRHRAVEARPAEAPADTPSAPPPPDAGPRLRDAGAVLMQRLSPQERAALVLKEVFDMTLEESAGILGTTVGAVKSALHRGRGRLAEPEGGAASQRPGPSPELVDRFIDRFRAEDLDGLLALMLETGATENVGNSFHTTLDPDEGMRRVLHAIVFGHAEWPESFQFDSRRVERIAFEGEWILGFFVSGERGEALMTVMRFDEHAGRIARLRSYGFCPEVVRAVAAELGVPAWTGIYRAPTPAPGEDWPETG
ncbi:MAG: sigma-70 family RNA polymerase sigma factor [Myxococcota bacterium]